MKLMGYDLLTKTELITLESHRFIIELADGTRLELFQIEKEPDKLTICVDGTLLVYPRSSNLIRIKLEQ